MPTLRASLMFYGVALTWFLTDQWTKLEVVRRLAFGESWPVIPGSLAFTHVTNTGGAWSVLAGNTLFLGLLSAGVCLGLMVYERRFHPRTWAETLAWASVLGGAAGNMLDRLRLGYVVDMVDLQRHGQNIFPIFNVADVAIDVGVGLIVLLSFWQAKPRAASPPVEEPAA